MKYFKHITSYQKLTAALATLTILIASLAIPVIYGQAPESAAAASRTAEAIQLHIDDPDQLLRLEQAGLSLPALLAGLPADSNNAKLANSPAYQTLYTSLSDDLKQRLRQDFRLSTSMAKAHRLFNAKWLSSAAAHYELTGVINRLDRVAFTPAHCGEVRLLYRLAYQLDSGVYSRLPMTLNIVYLPPRDSELGCQPASRIWQRFIENEDSAELLSLLTTLKSIEVNLQAIRWPSTVRPDMGGYAEYFMRAFKPIDDVLPPKNLRLARLENTPDIAKIQRQPQLREALKAWLIANASALESGTATLPDQFLATKVSSHALHGIERLSNQRFNQLFDPTDFANINYAGFTYVKGPDAFLRRLDNLSCSGCHQSRSVAGFHFVGIDRAQTHPINSVAVAQSGHFLAEQSRRKAYFSTVLSNSDATNQPLVSGFAERDATSVGERGAHCSLTPAANQQFPGWNCAEGLSCQPHDLTQNGLIGRCAPEKPQVAGDACMTGTIKPHANPTKDRLVDAEPQSCQRGICQTVAVGFPGGVCSTDCSDLKPGEACGAIARLGGFNACLANQGLFSDCLSNNSFSAGLQACDANTACRDDYICARQPATNTVSSTGVCIPPYFLFQLRVDGHPSPP